MRRSRALSDRYHGEGTVPAELLPWQRLARLTRADKILVLPENAVRKIDNGEAILVRKAETIPMDFLRPYAPQLLSLLRLMSGLLLLQHGTTKYLNFPVSPMNNASPATMSGAAGILELIGGVLLIIGLFTRPVAFILSGMTAVAYFYAHAPRGFFPILNGGELAALYCFVFLYIASAGGGAWSIDRIWAKGDERRLAPID